MSPVHLAIGGLRNGRLVEVEAVDVPQSIILERCPDFILAPSHWIGGHKIEECGGHPWTPDP